MLQIQTATEKNYVDGYLILSEVKFWSLKLKILRKRTQKVKKEFKNFTFHDYLAQCCS